MSIIKKILIIIAVLILNVSMVIFFLFILPFIGSKKIEDARTFADGRIITIGKSFSVVYLLDGGNGQIGLVDTGVSPLGVPILKALESRGLKPSDVKAVFLTHGHTDHIGAAGLFTEARIYALTPEVPIVEGLSLNKSPINIILCPVQTGFRVKAPLNDGDQIDLGSLHIEVFSVPGHTEGSAVYLINGILFMGDTAFGRKDNSLKGAVWVFSTDVDQNDRSLKALTQRLLPRADQIKEIVFAHTGSVSGLKPLLDYVNTIH